MTTNDRHERDRPIDRCLCLGLLFTDLKEIAERRGLQFDGLQKATRCSTGCGMCEPYIRVMLQTGETRFPVMSPTELAKACAQDDAPSEA